MSISGFPIEFSKSDLAMEELNFHRKGKYTVVLELVGSKTWFSLLWITAPDNHYTTHCSLLDAYVAQSTLVPTKENLLKQFSPTWPHWAELVIELPCACVCLCLCVCAIECSFFSRPLIGPQTTWTDPGLSLPVKSGPQKWRSNVDPKSGSQKWTQKMAPKSRHQK